MTFSGYKAKTPIQSETRPQLVEKSTGQLYLLVRDDTAANGKLYVAPIGMMTSMTSLRPEAFKERFEWYVAPGDRPVPVDAITVREIPGEFVKNKGGRPRGSKDKRPRKRPAPKDPESSPVTA